MHPSFLRTAALICLLSPLLAPAPAPAQPTRPAAVERLAHLARVWGAVRYLHPYLAYRDIDWDAALVQAIPAVRAAETPEQYAAAVQSLLAVLGDPATGVEPEPPEAGPPPAPGEKPPLFRWLNDGKALAVDLRFYEGFSGYLELQEQLATLGPELRKAPAVIVDLRSRPGEARSRTHFGYALQRMESLLVRRTVRAPTQRHLMHSGYRPQRGGGSGGYYSGFVTLFAETFSPARADAGPESVAFLVDSRTTVPAVALALQAAGDGIIVAEGPLDERAAVFRKTVELGEGFVAQVRTSEVVPMAGWSGIHADVELAAGAGDAAFQAALAAVSGRRPERGSEEPPLQPLPEAVWRPDRRYAEMLEPALEYRLLAVFRAWNVIEYFYPYKHLIGDWSAVLPEFIARMEEARGGRDYAVGMAEMMARVADGHTSIGGHPELVKILGDGGLPIILRWIEGRFVVLAVGDDPAVKDSGIAVGDVVEAVDGEPVEARAERLRRILAASTEWGLRDRLRRFLLTGADGSTAVLTVSGEDGRRREVALKREQRFLWFAPAAAGETVRLLPGNLGYADLTRLTVAEVDAMFEKLKNARAIVFDMRGYPLGTAWEIAPRLNNRESRQPVFAAQFRRAEVSALSDEEVAGGFFFSQPLPVSKKWKYPGKTVMLIDERAISQSEHTGLFFEAANGTRFIGTPTAGANGDTTSFTLPGNLFVTFTGHDVRHADGRQLQRTGLVPHVEVAPTIRGIREGRDEVLERAIGLLTRELAAGSPADRAAAPGNGGGSAEW